jgi:predicted ATPase/DNA-binding SARP family transcriptional activator
MPGPGTSYSVEVLGDVQVWRGPLAVELGSPKQRAVFSYLALQSGELCTMDALVQAVWGDPAPSRARHLVHTYVARLRQALEPERPPRGRTGVIASTPLGYRMVLDEREVDVQRFRWLVLQAEAEEAAARWGPALELFGAALRLWRDPSLSEHRGLLTVLDELNALQQQWIDVALRYLRLGLEHGAEAVVLRVAEQLTQLEPLEEEAHLRYLTALQRTGQHGVAVQRYRALRDRLRDELGVEPTPPLRALYGRLLAADVDQPTASGVAPAPVWAPQRSPWRGTGPGLGELVCRDVEAERIAQNLARSRMITLAGPAGVGKSALALDAAADRRDSFSGGVAVVDLSNLGPGDLPDEPLLRLFDAAGDDPVRVIGDQHLLVVFDGAELVVDACAELVDRLVRGCWYVSVIVTSREPLGLPYETVRRLAPLPLPGEDTPAATAESPAVRLFAARAAQVRTGFQLGPHNLDLVHRICIGLDGLPLALETASACLATDNLTTLARKAEDPLVRIRPVRRGVSVEHRSLRAALARSLRGMTRDERWLFARLGRLPRRFVLADAIGEAARDTTLDVDLPQLLGRLVDKSVLSVSEGPAGQWFEMLRLVHRFAAGLSPDPQLQPVPVS